MGETNVSTGVCGRAAGAQDLRARWGRRSQEAGWDPPGDWWTPAVDAVCEALAAGTDLVDPCARLGAARGRSGVGIGQSLTDLAAFTGVAGWAAPPFELVRALAEGWVDAGRAQDTCQDPLTGMGTDAYLRTRVGELYRAPEGAVPAALDHQLVVLALDPSIDPWRRAARLIVLGYELRRYFSRGESVCVVDRGRIAVVASRSDQVDRELEALRRGPGWEHGVAVWSVPLPPTLREALTLLDGLGRQRR
jgi:hypothetical protein